MQHTYQNLISYVENIKERNYSSAAALVIVRNNQIVLEHYSGYHSNAGARPVTEASQFNVASVRKSYLGLAVAFALFEGRIGSLDDSASDYFNEYDREVLGGTTIRHLVTHSHGIDERGDGTIYREFAPGADWAYRGVNVRMMAELVNRLYGKPFTVLLRERVFQPMGWRETDWQTSPGEKLVKVVDDPDESAAYKLGSSSDGSESNLHVSAREFAMWGNLHLNKGFLNGKQIVPREVIQLATRIHSPSYKNKELPQNGLFWYVQGEPALKSELGERVPRGSYQILGVTGPTILVIPEYNVVVAKMYNKRYNFGDKDYLYYLREFSNLVADTFRKQEGG